MARRRHRRRWRAGAGPPGHPHPGVDGGPTCLPPPSPYADTLWGAQGTDIGGSPTIVTFGKTAEGWERIDAVRATNLAQSPCAASLQLNPIRMPTVRAQGVDDSDTMVTFHDPRGAV